MRYDIQDVLLLVLAITEGRTGPSTREASYEDMARYIFPQKMALIRQAVTEALGLPEVTEEARPAGKLIAELQGWEWTIKEGDDGTGDN